MLHLSVDLRKKSVTSVGKEVISKEFAVHHKPMGRSTLTQIKIPEIYPCHREGTR